MDSGMTPRGKGEWCDCVGAAKGEAQILDDDTRKNGADIKIHRISMSRLSSSAVGQ